MKKTLSILCVCIVIIAVLISAPCLAQQTGEWYQNGDYGLYRSDPDVQLVTGINIIHMMEKNFSRLDLVRDEIWLTNIDYRFRNSEEEKIDISVSLHPSVQHVEDYILGRLDGQPNIFAFGPRTSGILQDVQFGDNMFWSGGVSQIYFIRRNAYIMISCSSFELLESVATMLDTAINVGSEFVSYQDVSTLPDVTGFTLSRENLQDDDVVKIIIDVVNTDFKECAIMYKSFPIIGTSIGFSKNSGALKVDSYTFEARIVTDFNYFSEIKTYTVNLNAPVTVEATAAEMPDIFTLYPNAPNPFNPTTSIRFDLSEAGEVRLDVYDMLGRGIATIVSEHLSAGNHSFSFDGSGFSSGVYIYRLIVGGKSETGRMTLLR